MGPLKDFLEAQEISFEINLSLSKKTWVHTGGICHYWIVPNSLLQLRIVCQYLYEHRIDFQIVGQTSNLFFHSTFTPEVVISTVHVDNYVMDGDFVVCDCGLSVIKLAKECISKGYAGFSGLTGLPGTLAASVYNNAGCFGCSISSMMVSAYCMFPDGTLRDVFPGEFRFGHRTSAMKRNELQCVVLSVTLQLTKASSIESESEKSIQAMAYRREHQERHLPNLGSVFSQMNMKHNLRNVISVTIAKLLSFFKISDYSRILKGLLLGLYGYRDLSPYISDKSLNIFVWRDGGAEMAFQQYKQFMKTVYNNLSLEIEERV